jgi:hypothetical protein
MYCPKCSQPLTVDELRFCSRCGLPLAALTQIVLANGETKKKTEAAPRQKGIRQGVILISLSVILIPAYILLAALFPANDRLVESAVSDTPFEKISQALLITLFMLGLARLLYARLFQSGAPVPTESVAATQFQDSSVNYSLPDAQGTPVSDFGTWRETGEIVKRSEQH